MKNGDMTLDEEFQIKLYKRIRKRELNASVVFLCILVFVSYICEYVLSVSAFYAARSIPQDYRELFLTVSDILGYILKLSVPVILYLVYNGRKAGELFSPEAGYGESTEKEKISFAKCAAYTLCAISLSRIMAYFSAFFSAVVSAVLSLFSENLVLDSAAFDVASPSTLGGFVIELFAVALLPAVFEELFFRGVMLSELTKYGKSFAICASAVFFALSHGSAEQMMYSFVYGLIFGYAVVKTGSLMLGMIMHFVNNALSCTVIYLEGVFEGSRIFEDIITVTDFTLVFAGLVIAAVCIAGNRIAFSERNDSEKGEAELTGSETFSVLLSPIMLVYYAIIIYETMYVYISYNMRI